MKVYQHKCEGCQKTVTELPIGWVTITGYQSSSFTSGGSDANARILVKTSDSIWSKVQPEFDFCSAGCLFDWGTHK